MGKLPIVVLLYLISSFVRSSTDNSMLNQVNREVQLFLLFSLSCTFPCVFSYLLCTYSPINPNSSPSLSFVCAYTQSIDFLKRFPVWKLLETELFKLNESIWTARKRKVLKTHIDNENFSGLYVFSYMVRTNRCRKPTDFWRQLPK